LRLKCGTALERDQLSAEVCTCAMRCMSAYGEDRINRADAGNSRAIELALSVGRHADDRADSGEIPAPAGAAGDLIHYNSGREDQPYVS